jgi:osmoprotectant transport system permease protein
MIPLFGIGKKPALVALFAYALLPIVASTFSALDALDRAALEAARGMGMRPIQVLTKVALPLGVPIVMRGIRVATVINVGVATLGALIGAGGLGTFIFRGIALVDTKTILTGAVPAAVLALLFDGGLALVERALVPRGLRER